MLWALVKLRCGSGSLGECGLVPSTDPGAESKYSPHLCLHAVVKVQGLEWCDMHGLLAAFTLD